MRWRLLLLTLLTLSESAYAQNVNQSDARCSPVVAGVTGNVNIEIKCPEQNDSTILRLNSDLAQANQVVAKLRTQGDIDRRQNEIMLWQSIQYSPDAADYEIYLRKYPRGLFADIAEVRARRIRASVDLGGFALLPSGDRICRRDVVQGNCAYLGKPGSGACFSSGYRTSCKMADGSWVPLGH
jgi:hypothetical protein